MKFLSEPPAAARFFCGEIETSRLKFSSLKIKNFDRDRKFRSRSNFFDRLGPLGGRPFPRMTPSPLLWRALSSQIFFSLLFGISFPKGPKIEKIQSRLKISIALEIFNLDWNFQSWPQFPTKIGVWWVVRLKFSISIENFNPGGRSWIFSIFGPLGLLFFWAFSLSFPGILGVQQREKNPCVFGGFPSQTTRPYWKHYNALIYDHRSNSLLVEVSCEFPLETRCFRDPAVVFDYPVVVSCYHRSELIWP